VSPVAGGVGCFGFSAPVAPEEEPPVEEPEPIEEEPEPVLEPAPAADELSLFGASLEVLAEPEADLLSLAGALEDGALEDEEPEAAEPSDFFSVLAEDEPPAAEPSDFFWLFADELLPPAAEPLMPRAARVSWSIWPDGFRFLDVWNSFRPFCVFGPRTPSTWPTSWPCSFSLVCTCLITSAFCPPAMPPPAAALLFALPPEEAPAAAEPLFFSLDMLPLADEPPEVLPLAAGALELEDLSVEVDAPPDVLLPELALPLALVSAGFCSVLEEALPLADGVDVDGVDALPLADGVDVLPDALPDVLLSEVLGWLIVDELEPDCCSFFVSCA